jgi:hypothetical protein
MKNDDNFNAGLAYADYKQALLFFILAGMAAFLMSSYFMVSYSTGGIDFDKWGAMEWKYAITAIMVTAVMTGFQFRLYGNGDMKNGGKVGVVAVVVAVAFSLLSEVGQGMERDEVRMETKSQESPTYQAAIAALGNAGSASYNPYSTDLQAAEVKLAQCQARLAQGKEKHCEGSAARVEAVNKMIANHSAASQQQAAALLAQAKSMEKDESNYFPIVGVIVEWLGVSGKTASLLFSVIIIGMFEYAFHYLGGDLNRARQKLMQHGYDVTRKLRQPPRKHDGSVSTYSDTSAPISAFTNGANSARQTVGEYAAKVESGLKASPEIIATEYGRAQYAREQMAEKTGDVLQKVGNAIYSGKSENPDWKTDAPEIKETTGFKQSPDQAANVSKLYQDGLKDHAAGKVFNDTPTPPIKRQSVAETINALLDAVKKSGANTEADIQAAVFDGYSKLFNPAEFDDKDLMKVAAKIADKPASKPVDTLSTTLGSHVDKVQQGNPPNDKQGSNKVPDKGQQGNDIFDMAIEIIRQGIQQGAINKVSVSDKGQCQALLVSAGIGKNNPQRREILSNVFESLASEGLVMANPEYTDSRCGRDKWLIVG